MTTVTGGIIHHMTVHWLCTARSTYLPFKLKSNSIPSNFNDSSLLCCLIGYLGFSCVFSRDKECFNSLMEITHYENQINHLCDL